MQLNFVKKTDGPKLPRGLIGGTFSLSVSTIIVKLLGLIYKIPLSAILGDEGMGYFNSAYTVYAFFYLLCTAGVPKAVMILVSEADAKGKGIEERRIFRVALIMFFILGVIITTVFICCSGLLSDLIGNSKSAATMIAIAPSIIFISLSGVIRGYLSAKTKLLDIAVSQIIEGVGKLALGLIFAELGTRLSLPLEIISALTILGVSFGALFGLIYLFFCCKVKPNSLIMKKEYNKWLVIKRLFAISIPITLSASIMSITNIIDLGLIMRSLCDIGYTEKQASALYGNYTTLAVPMLNLAISLITPISVAFLPSLTCSIVNHDFNGLWETEKSSIKLSAFVSAPITMGLMIFPKEILDLLFKNSEIKIGAALLLVLAPSVLFSSLLINLNTLLEASGRIKAPLISMLFGSAAKIALSNYLITKTDLGILGAPVGTVVSYAVALLVSLVIYCNGFKHNIPIFSTYFPAYSFAFVSVIIGRIMYDTIGGGIVFLLPCILLCALIYIGFWLFFANFNGTNKIKLAELTKMS